MTSPLLPHCTVTPDTAGDNLGEGEVLGITHGTRSKKVLECSAGLGPLHPVPTKVECVQVLLRLSPELQIQVGRGRERDRVFTF